MGGTLILLAIVLPTLLWADLTNLYVWIALFVTIGFGAVGFIDDWRKVKKKNSDGLSARQKMFWLMLICLGCRCAPALLQRLQDDPGLPVLQDAASRSRPGLHPLCHAGDRRRRQCRQPDRRPRRPGDRADDHRRRHLPALRLSGRQRQAGRLPADHRGQRCRRTGVLCGAMVGAGLGFLWFNTYPAQVFMGDVGSLSLGGALGTIAVITKQEIVLVDRRRHLRHGGALGHRPGHLVPSLRQTDLPHGADPSSLRAEGLAGTEDHRPFLDHQHHSGPGRDLDPETALMRQGKPYANRLFATEDRGRRRRRSTGIALCRYFPRPRRRGDALGCSARPNRLTELANLTRSASTLDLGGHTAALFISERSDRHQPRRPAHSCRPSRRPHAAGIPVLGEIEIACAGIRRTAGGDHRHQRQIDDHHASWARSLPPGGSSPLSAAISAPR